MQKSYSFISNGQSLQFCDGFSSPFRGRLYGSATNPLGAGDLPNLDLSGEETTGHFKHPNLYAFSN